MSALTEGFAVPPMRKVEIRAHAVNARNVLNLGDRRIDIPRLLDRLSADFGVNYDVIDEHSGVLPRGVEACYVPEARTLYISAPIFSEMSYGGQRAVFTLGHELGHIVLAHQRTLNRRQGQLPIFCNSEWQANCFAAEFTMPASVITAYHLHTPDLIAERFGVSREAARNRLLDLGIHK